MNVSKRNIQAERQNQEILQIYHQSSNIGEQIGDHKFGTRSLPGYS